MGRRVARESETRSFTGPIEFDVTTHGGSPLGRFQMRVGRDYVEIFYGARNLGLIDRARLRGWLRRPEQPLHVDQVTLREHGRDLLLALDPAAPAFPVPRRFAAQLRALV